MSRNRYVLKCIHRRGWSHSTETHFTPMKSTGSCLFTWETSHLKFAHERCVTSSRSRTRELPLEQWLTLINRANPRKKYTDLFGHGYTIDLYNSPVSLGRAVCFVGKGCALGITRRGETTHSGVDVNNTHRSMINPLNQKQLLNESIDQSLTQHNTPVPYPTMHQFITKMCTILLQNRALWVIFLMYCGICEIDESMRDFTLKQLYLL